MSKGRDLYLERIKNNTTSAEDFVKALETSPYTTHRNVAVGLRGKLQIMIDEDELKRMREARHEFEKSLELEG